jgi:hypothetical protein
MKMNIIQVDGGRVVDGPHLLDQVHDPSFARELDEHRSESPPIRRYVSKDGFDFRVHGQALKTLHVDVRQGTSTDVASIEATNVANSKRWNDPAVWCGKVIPREPAAPWCRVVHLKAGVPIEALASLAALLASTWLIDRSAEVDVQDVEG